MASLLDKCIYGLVKLTSDESFAAIGHLASRPALRHAPRAANRPGSQRVGISLNARNNRTPESRRGRCEPGRFAVRSELEAALQAVVSGISGLAPERENR